MSWDTAKYQRQIVQKLNELGPNSKENSLRHAFLLWGDDVLTDDNYSSRPEPERIFGGMASRAMFDSFVSSYEAYAAKEESKFTGYCTHLLIGTNKYTFLVFFDLDSKGGVAHCLVGVANTEDLLYAKAVREMKVVVDYLNSL